MMSYKMKISNKSQCLIKDVNFGMPLGLVLLLLLNNTGSQKFQLQ